MKKTTLLIVTLCFFCSLYTTSLVAEQVSKETVIDAATTFLVLRYPTADETSVRTISSRGQSAFEIQDVIPINVADTMVGYIVDLEPSGYIIFSGDDQAPPIKFYSDNGSFDDLPPGLKKVLELELHEDQIILSSQIIQVDQELNDFSYQWEYLTAKTR